MLLLADFKLVLPDLIEKKGPLFESTNTGKTYLPLLIAQLAKIDALPEGKDGGAVHAEALLERDAEHDGYGGAIWHLAEAYARVPNASDKVRTAAARIRAQFIPKLRELQGSYADEARRARDRKAVLDEYEDDLKLFPVAEKQTLYTWVNGYLEAGLALNELLSDRADTPIDSRAEAAPLRTATMGILSRMRGALVDEVMGNKMLPRDLELQVFPYVDQMTAMREMQRATTAAGAAKKKKGKAAPPEGGTEGGKGEPDKG